MRQQIVLLLIILGSVTGLSSAGEGSGESASLTELVRDINARLKSETISPDSKGTLVVEVRAPVGNGNIDAELPGANVRVRALGCDGFSSEGHADVRGRVSVAGVPAGLYVLGVSMPGYEPHFGTVLLLAAHPTHPRVHLVVTLKETTTLEITPAD